MQASNAEFLCEHNFDFNKVPVGTDLASFPGSHHAWSLGIEGRPDLNVGWPSNIKIMAL